MDGDRAVEATLELDGETATVIIEKATVDVDHARLRRCDPYLLPPAFREEIQFVSKHLQAYIHYAESDVTIESVRPVDEPLPDISPGSSDFVHSQQ